MVSKLLRIRNFFFSTNMETDMDKMVSIKGLVIRTTPVIPDMKTGK